MTDKTYVTYGLTIIAENFCFRKEMLCNMYCVYLSLRKLLILAPVIYFAIRKTSANSGQESGSKVHNRKIAYMAMNVQPHGELFKF